MVLFLLLAQTQIVSVKAGSDHQESTHNPAAEEYLKAEILKDGSADLAEAFPEKSQRVVRGEFIVSLWKDPDLQGIPFFKIYNTTILGDIPAEGISFPFNVEFWSCEFNGRIEMSRASVQSFNMYDSVVTGAVSMGRMEAAGDLALYNTTYQSAVVLFAGPVACPGGGSNPGRELCPPFTLEPPTGGPVPSDSQAVTEDLGYRGRFGINRSGKGRHYHRKKYQRLT